MYRYILENLLSCFPRDLTRQNGMFCSSSLEHWLEYGMTEHFPLATTWLVINLWSQSPGVLVSDHLPRSPCNVGRWNIMFSILLFTLNLLLLMKLRNSRVYVVLQWNEGEMILGTLLRNWHWKCGTLPQGGKWNSCWTGQILASGPAFQMFLFSLESALSLFQSEKMEHFHWETRTFSQFLSLFTKFSLVLKISSLPFFKVFSIFITYFTSEIMFPSLLYRWSALTEAFPAHL